MATKWREQLAASCQEAKGFLISVATRNLERTRGRKRPSSAAPYTQREPGVPRRLRLQQLAYHCRAGQHHSLAKNHEPGPDCSCMSELSRETRWATLCLKHGRCSLGGAILSASKGSLLKIAP